MVRSAPRSPASGHRTEQPVWQADPLRRREVYEEKSSLLTDVPMIGRMDLQQAVCDALPIAQHPGIYEVHLVQAGSLEMCIGASCLSCAVRGGMAVLTPPGEPHGGASGMINPARFGWVQIRAAAAEPILSPLGMHQPPHADASRVFRYSPATADCFDRLLDEHRRRGLDSVAMARCILQELVLCLGRDIRAHHAGQASSGFSPPVRTALRWLDLHLTQETSAAEMAQAAGMSERQFRRRFLEDSGFTPADYITRKLVERACDLLRRAEGSISNIAMQLGFSTPAHFAAVFRRHTGQTPTSYRRSHAELRFSSGARQTSR